MANNIAGLTPIRQRRATDNALAATVMKTTTQLAFIVIDAKNPVRLP